MMLARHVRGDGALRPDAGARGAQRGAAPVPRDHAPQLADPRPRHRVEGGRERALQPRRDRSSARSSWCRPTAARSAPSPSSGSGSERSLALSLRLYSTETLFILIVDSVLALGHRVPRLGRARTRCCRASSTIGALTIFLAYLKDMYQPVQNIAQNLKELSSARAGLDRVFAVLDVQPDIQDAPDARPLPSVAGRDPPRGRELRLRRGEAGARNVDACASPRARRSRSWGAPAPARARSRAWCCASSTRSRAA